MPGRLTPVATAGAILVLSLLLGACQTTAQQGKAPAAASTQATEATKAVEEDARQEISEDQPALEAPAQEAALPPGGPAPPSDPEPEEIEVDADPARFLGLDLAALEAELGPPRLEREEDPARIWQYRDATCVLDLYLYEEAGRYRVTYLEARDPAARTLPAEECLRPLLQARAKALTG